jgi:hypothetical protein
MHAQAKPFSLLASLLLAVFAAPPAAADLPGINEQPWLGHFAGLESKRFKFGITSKGEMTLTPIDDKGKEVSFVLAIPINIGIEEVMPDGRVSLRGIQPETLETKDATSTRFEKATIRGKTTGDASFEATIEMDRGALNIGGRITDPGTLTKNPIRFAVVARIPSAYRNEKPADKRAEKAFQKKIEDDRIELRWTDGKRLKQTFEKDVDAASAEINGPGIAAAIAEITAYRGRKFEFTASENSSMRLRNTKPGPLHTGFSIHWTPDAAKDPEGKARLTIEVK